MIHVCRVHCPVWEYKEKETQNRPETGERAQTKSTPQAKRQDTKGEMHPLTAQKVQHVFRGTHGRPFMP